MTDYLAHSARDGRPPQTYARHVEGVRRLALHYAEAAGRFAPEAQSVLLQVVGDAAEVHDLGKLEDENQKALNEPDGRKHLPVHHQDAGAAWLVQKNALLSALLVKYHHRGLCDLVEESTEDRPFCRDEDAMTRTRTDRGLAKMAQRHQALGILPRACPEMEVPGDLSVFLRMALSCLADADHTDTAQHYGQYPAQDDAPSLRPKERLAKLDRYVAGLCNTAQQANESTRNTLRREMYAACRNSVITGGFAACDSPVGSGKTTAVMAHLLRQAQARGARRIIVVLPFTCIISQSVAVYRECLTLSGENPEQIVAELHFRADYQHMDTRMLTALWRAPIIVTTAVSFFETLAANRPAALRRLHELPGSMIFVDEAHAALPARLLPLAWHWMNVLAKEWGCYWVLASGSLARFWKLDAFRNDRPALCELVNHSLRERLMTYERQRVSFRWARAPKSRNELVHWVASFPGPRLLIVNTVQSAAVIADDFQKAYGRERVEHLSAALTAEDREKTIERVIARLNDSSDKDWTLVATSCVEAGVNFSFRTGFREVCSVMSLLQTAGRVKRHGGAENAEVWSIALQDDPMLRQNPGFKASVAVLKRYLHENVEITPELSTRALRDELNENDSMQHRADELLQDEADGAFRTVAENFVVIDNDNVVIVPDFALAEKVRSGQADWRLIQRHGISISRRRAQALKLEELATDVFAWPLAYDDFIGYMAGLVH